MKFGYARVSTDVQNLNLQIDELKNYGIDKIFKEKVSGIKWERPQLTEMEKMLRVEDSVIVYKLEHFSRSAKYLIELSETFESLGVNFISLKDNVDISFSMGKFFFQVMASLSKAHNTKG